MKGNKMAPPARVPAWETRVGWTDERVTLLKARYAEGLSAGRIGAEMGITRNAVIGKCTRLGLTEKPKMARAATSPAKAKAIRVHQQRVFGAPVVEEVERFSVDFAPSTLASDADIPRAQLKTLFDLNPGECRWPVGTPGEPGFGFCAGAALWPEPYCGPHCRRAYNGMAARSRTSHLNYPAPRTTR